MNNRSLMQTHSLPMSLSHMASPVMQHFLWLMTSSWPLAFPHCIPLSLLLPVCTHRWVSLSPWLLVHLFKCSSSLMHLSFSPSLSLYPLTLLFCPLLTGVCCFHFTALQSTDPTLTISIENLFIHFHFSSSFPLLSNPDRLLWNSSLVFLIFLTCWLQNTPTVNLIKLHVERHSHQS